MYQYGTDCYCKSTIHRIHQTIAPARPRAPRRVIQTHCRCRPWWILGHSVARAVKGGQERFEGAGLRWIGFFFATFADRFHPTVALAIAIAAPHSSPERRLHSVSENSSSGTPGRTRRPPGRPGPSAVLRTPTVDRRCGLRPCFRSGGST